MSANLANEGAGLAGACTTLKECPMATATKAAAEKAENAVAQVTETVSSTVSKATAVANDLVTKTTDAFAPIVKSAEEKTQELTAAFADEVKKAEAKAQELAEAWTEEYKKAEAKAKEYTETFTAEVKKVVVISVDTYAEAVQKYLDLTVEFVETLKNDAVLDLTKKNAKTISELVEASVSQTKD